MQPANRERAAHEGAQDRASRLRWSRGCTCTTRSRSCWTTWALLASNEDSIFSSAALVDLSTSVCDDDESPECYVHGRASQWSIL